jgi:hypothetical protein
MVYEMEKKERRKSVNNSEGDHILSQLSQLLETSYLHKSPNSNSPSLLPSSSSSAGTHRNNNKYSDNNKYRSANNSDDYVREKHDRANVVNTALSRDHEILRIRSNERTVFNTDIFDRHDNDDRSINEGNSRDPRRGYSGNNQNNGNIYDNDLNSSIDNSNNGRNDHRVDNRNGYYSDIDHYSNNDDYSSRNSNNKDNHNNNNYDNFKGNFNNSNNNSNGNSYPNKNPSVSSPNYTPNKSPSPSPLNTATSKGSISFQAWQSKLHPNPGSDPRSKSNPDSTYTASNNPLPNERKLRNIQNINDRNVRNVSAQNVHTNRGNVSTNRSMSSNRSGSTNRSLNTDSVRASNGSVSACTNKSNRTVSINTRTGEKNPDRNKLSSPDYFNRSDFSDTYSRADAEADKWTAFLERVDEKEREKKR